MNKFLKLVNLTDGSRFELMASRVNHGGRDTNLGWPRVRRLESTGV